MQCHAWHMAHASPSQSKKKNTSTRSTWHGQLKAWREPMPSAMLRYIQLGCWRNPRDSEQSVTSTHASSWEQSQVGTSLGDVENPRWMSPLAEQNIKVSRCCQVNKKELGNRSVVNSHGMNDRRSKFKHEWYIEPIIIYQRRWTPLFFSVTRFAKVPLVFKTPWHRLPTFTTWQRK